MHTISFGFVCDNFEGTLEESKPGNDTRRAQPFSLLNDRKCLRGCFFHYNGFLSELMNIYLKGRCVHYEVWPRSRRNRQLLLAATLYVSFYGPEWCDIPPLSSLFWRAAFSWRARWLLLERESWINSSRIPQLPDRKIKSNFELDKHLYGQIKSWTRFSCNLLFLSRNSLFNAGGKLSFQACVK
jgi:hypothetical protein